MSGIFYRDAGKRIPNQRMTRDILQIARSNLLPSQFVDNARISSPLLLFEIRLRRFGCVVRSHALRASRDMACHLFENTCHVFLFWITFVISIFFRNSFLGFEWLFLNSYFYLPLYVKIVKIICKNWRRKKSKICYPCSNAMKFTLQLVMIKERWNLKCGLNSSTAHREKDP